MKKLSHFQPQPTGARFRLFLPVLMMLTLLLSPSTITVFSISAVYPSVTQSGDDVTLTKSAAWVGIGQAEVTLAFEGLEHVYTAGNPSDVIFILDTSGSMGTYYRCIHEDHRSYVVDDIWYVTKGVGDEVYKQYNALIDEVIANGDLSVRDFDDEGTPAKLITTENPDLRIPIPEELWSTLTMAKTTTLTPGVSEVVMVPLMAQWKMDETYMPLYWDDVSKRNYPLTWGFIDLTNTKTPFEATNAHYPGFKDAGNSDKLLYHMDENGNRVYLEMPIVGGLLNSNYSEYDVRYSTMPTSYFCEYPTGALTLDGRNVADILFDDDAIPVSWNQFHEEWGCFQRVHVLYDTSLSFTQQLLESSDDSRAAFAAFNSSSRRSDFQGARIESQGYMEFTDDYDQFSAGIDSVIPYTGQLRSQTQAAAARNIQSQGTNYQAGIQSARQIIDDDADHNNGNDKYIIFITDGDPNMHYMDGYNNVDGSGTHVVNTTAAASLPYALDAAQELFDQYPEYTMHAICIYDESGNDADVNVQPILDLGISPGNLYQFSASDERTLAEAFEDIFADLYQEIAMMTKIVTIEDVIDEGFSVDIAALSANTDHAYYPSYCTATVENIICGDGQLREKVTFTYTVTEKQELLEKATIPLTQKPGAPVNSDGYLPTNYDGDRPGAITNYLDLDGVTEKTVATERTWLPVKGDLVVSKTVTGASGNKSKLFTFDITLKDGDSISTDTYTITGPDGSDTITGSVAITLKHGQSVIIEDLPGGLWYSVVEREADQDGYTTNSQNSQGHISASATAASFINSKGGGGGPGPGPGPNPKPDPAPEEDEVEFAFTDDHFAYIVGYPDPHGGTVGTVRPGSDITRAEAASIFFRLVSDDYREDVWTNSNQFSDVASSSWYNIAVSTMARANVLSGYPDGSFRPDDPITRAEFATIVAHFVREPEHNPNPKTFSDVSDHWAQEFIATASALGWVEGYPDNSFRPDNHITRAETASLVNRVLGRLPESEQDLLANMVTWPDNADVSAWYYLAIQEATNSHYYERKEDGVHETWIKLRESRDWSLLERPGSTLIQN